MIIKPLHELSISLPPWTVDEDGGIVDALGYCVYGGVDEIEDSRMMAAAPDLYKSLRETLIALRNRLPSEPTLEEIEIIDRAEDAMAKAGGAA